MLDLLNFGSKFISALQDLGNALNSTFEVPIIGTVCVLDLITGVGIGGLLVLLIYRIVKWFTDIVL